jgi:tetratricopeptide (TPR) repeat protein
MILAAGSMLAGCGGPTKAGIEARENARQRLDLVNADLGYDQANQAFEAGQFDKALREINTALQLYPASPKFHVLQGRIYLETHRLEKAIESFDAALERDSSYAEPHYYSGIVYQRWSDDEKSFEHYMTAYELESSSVAYLLAAGESLVALGRFDQARRLIKERLAYFEHNAALRYLLGQIALLQGDPQTAAKLYAEAWRFDPDDQMLLEELANAQLAAGLYGECLKSVKQLQGMSRERRPDLMHFEARCLTFMERLEEARNLYLELTRFRPTDPEVWIDLGTVAWELGDFHRLALCGARITALAPERYEGYMFKGINERHHDNLPEAITLLRQATTRTEETALPHLVLGRALEKTGDRQGALDAYAAAVRAEPDNVDARALFSQLTQDPQLATVPPPEPAGEE